MKALFPELNKESKEPLYLQLYKYIRHQITTGDIQAGEKLPSLRSLAKSTGLSITTIEQTYSQLLVEGYVSSRAQSGYYVNQINRGKYSAKDSVSTQNAGDILASDTDSSVLEDAMAADTQATQYYHDPACFDFNKWKKCMNKIINEFPESLFFESNPQGEMALRVEIAKYLYVSRGVNCTPSQIIIGAGTQQITNHIATMLRKMGIDNVAMEKPGYMPVRNIFRDRGFAITDVQVNSDGLALEKLPANIRTAAYVSPSNHIFTGSVMPIGRRNQLLNWAEDNDSYIIEDDYDSELRYFGRPIPALRSIGDNDRVIYLGSFSSTLFAAVKISYMVLPRQMTEMFSTMATDYSQTCSKLEQLSLAMFMETGNYQTHLRKLRKLYSQKLIAVTDFFAKQTDGFVDTKSSASGINILIRVNSTKGSDAIKRDAINLGIPLVPVQEKNIYLLYYNQIPLTEIPHVLQSLVTAWKRDA